MAARPHHKMMCGAGLILLTLAAGCEKALFTQNQPRTQFQTYDTMRQRYIPLEEYDEFGNKRPALRARLLR